jgi:protease I
MEEPNLRGMRVAIIATDLFEEAELIQPREALQRAGAQTVVVAPHGGEIQAVQHDKKTQKVKVDMTLDKAKSKDFDAVLIPGGAMNSDALRIEPKAQQLVREIDSEQKPIAVICHGPWLLISADLVRGHEMTSYHTIRDDVRNAGAIYRDEECVRDRNWVSSRQPSDIPRFNQEMLQLFDESFNRTRSESGYRGSEVA